jgi:hypothetical protein
MYAIGCEVAGAYLDEANVGGLLAEALTADVEAVLADQAGRVGADAAVGGRALVSFPSSQVFTPTMSSTLEISPSAVFNIRVGFLLPSAGALAVVARARVPDVLVSHFDGLSSLLSEEKEAEVGYLRSAWDLSSRMRWSRMGWPEFRSGAKVRKNRW